MSYLDGQVCLQLYITSRNIIRKHDKNLKAIKLTYPRALVLLALSEYSPCSIDVIAKRLCLDTGTLSPLIKNLLKDGFLRKERDLGDERKVLITLTKLGLEKVTQIKQIFDKAGTKLGLSDLRKKEILQFLNIINNN